MLFVEVPATARCRYAEPRAGKLDAAGLGRLVALAGQGRSLREVGAEVGLSAEGVRRRLRGLEGR